MSDPTGKLDLETHRRVFAERVVPRSALPETTPQARPHAIVLAGQPGAGKGNLVKAAQFEFSDNIVPIDPDAQREFHLDFKKLREAHPYTWSGHTHYDASRWAGELRDAAVAGRRNLIVDTTLGNADSAIKNIKGLQAKGYSVEVRVVATHRLESELGVDRRFTESLGQKGYGRHVPGEFHDAAYKALPANLDKVQEQTGARIRIYNREGVELYDSHTSPLKPSAALEQAREARMADSKITRSTAERAREQQDFHRRLPDTLERNPKINVETAKNLPPERQAQGVVPRVERTATETTAVDRSVRIEPGAARVALGLKVIGTAALAHDALTTGQDTRNLLDQNNLTGAQSQVMHFAGRNLGMVGGAMAVSSVAAMAGIETGPGAVVAGLGGGVLGAVAGDKIMDAVDRSRIYNQRGSDGNRWHLNEKHPERGWSRTVHTGVIAPHGIPAPAIGEPTYQFQTFQASASLADELNYKASNVAVELALAYAPVPKNPFFQPAGPGDAPAVDATSWTRDPATRQWSRYVADPTMAAMGVPAGHTEQANPQRSAQLDQAAQAVIANNIAHSPQAIAQQYQAAYNQYGWSRHGPVSAAVTTAIQTPPNQQRASDGHQYTQGANGQWTTPGTLYGTNTAQGNVRDELNATRRQVQTPPAAPVTPAASAPRSTPTPAVPTQPAPAPRVTPQESRTPPAPLPSGRMSFTEAHKRRDEPEQIFPDSLRPVGKLDPAQGTEAPRAQQTAQTRPEQSPAPSTPSTRPPQQRPERIDEPGHPGHDMFKQARRGLVELNANHGVVLSDERTDKLAAGLAASAALEGITRIDHVCLGTDSSKIFAAQGKAGSVFSKVAGGEVMPFMDAPLAQSSQTFVENQQQREALDQRFEQQWQQKLAQEAQQSQGQGRSMLLG